MIEQDKWYSLTEVVAKNFLPMLKSEYLIKKWIDSGNLKGIKIGRGKGTRYSMKGTWIIRFIAKWEAGDFH